MKKDIEWLKAQICIEMMYLEHNRKERWSGVKYQTLRSVSQKINQLDETEVLSQKWIDEHSFSLLDGYPWKKAVLIDDLQNLLVPKQELPVIPKYVADYIDGRKEVGFPIYQAIRIVRENSRFEHSHLREWLSTNKGQETFARAWLDGYEVEEEHKYYVLDSGDVPLLERVGNQIQRTTTELSIYEKGRDNSRFKLTEQEIKNYDERFWAFAERIEQADFRLSF